MNWSILPCFLFRTTSTSTGIGLHLPAAIPLYVLDSNIENYVISLNYSFQGSES